MLTPGSSHHQTNLFGPDLLLQLDPGDPLLKLADTIPRDVFDKAFEKHYSKDTGAPQQTHTAHGRLASPQAWRA